MESQLMSIDIPCVKRRIKRELALLLDNGICDESELSLTPTPSHQYTIGFTHKCDRRLYEFHLPSNYPFVPPRVTINQRPLRFARTLYSNAFAERLQTYTGIQCFCCESILCSNNWAPQFTCKDVLHDIEFYRKSIRQVIDRIIVDVIKRKYLIDDIPIIEWLY